MTLSSPLAAEGAAKPVVVLAEPDLMLACPATNLSRSRAMSSGRRAEAVVLESMWAFQMSPLMVAVGRGVCNAAAFWLGDPTLAHEKLCAKMGHPVLGWAR